MCKEYVGHYRACLQRVLVTIECRACCRVCLNTLQHVAEGVGDLVNNRACVQSELEYLFDLAVIKKLSKESVFGHRKRI